MNNEVKILGPDGKPLAPARPKLSALSGYSSVPYDAADRTSDQLANWQPSLWSPDNEINGFRNIIVARMRDMVRNDGWASGSVTRLLDNAVGACFRPLIQPDYRYLSMISGNKSFDAQWAAEYGRAIEAHYRVWATDPGRYCDQERKLTLPQMLRLAFRHKLVDGDALAVLHYRTDRLSQPTSKINVLLTFVAPLSAK